MKRLVGFPLLLIVLVGITGALVPASASARCAVIAFNPGLYNNNSCSASGANNFFMKVKNNGGTFIGGSLECIEVENFPAEPGYYSDNFCAIKTGEKRWVQAVIDKQFEWTIGGSAMTLKGLTSESVGFAQKTGSEFTLEGNVLGTAVVIKAKKLSSESAQIVAGGTDSGTLVFSELSVIKPFGCSVASPLKTKALKSELSTVGSTLYDKFVPVEGETLASVVISGCAIAGTYSLNGSFYGQAEPLFTELVSQPLTFSKVINEAAGGALTLGKEPATLSGEASYSLSGKNSGGKFGGI